MSLVVIWDQQGSGASICPPEIRAAVEPHLWRWMCIVPSWVREITMFYDGRETENTMRVHAHPDYHRASFVVGASFLGETEEARRRCVLHEVVHLILDPTRTNAEALLDVIKAHAPQAYELAKRYHSHAMEAEVSDLEWAISELDRR